MSKDLQAEAARLNATLVYQTSVPSNDEHAPLEVAVLTCEKAVGGCMVYSRYFGKDEWHCNDGERFVVSALLSELEAQKAAVQSWIECHDDWQRQMSELQQENERLQKLIQELEEESCEYRRCSICGGLHNFPDLPGRPTCPSCEKSINLQKQVVELREALGGFMSLGVAHFKTGFSSADKEADEIFNQGAKALASTADLAGKVLVDREQWERQQETLSFYSKGIFQTSGVMEGGFKVKAEYLEDNGRKAREALGEESKLEAQLNGEGV